MRNLHTFRCYKNVLKFVNFNKQITKQHITTKTIKINISTKTNTKTNKIMQSLNSKKHHNVHQCVDKFINQNSNHRNQIYFDCIMLIVVASKLKRCLSFIKRFCCVEKNAKTVKYYAMI